MKIIFEEEPVTQLRPRFTARPYPHEYDPPKVKQYKAHMNGEATLKMARLDLKPLTGALEVRATFYRPIQKSVSKKEQTKRDAQRILPDVKPDVDNYVKAFFDAMNGAIWEDDAQITDMQISKRYSNKPRIELEVLSLGEQ